MCLGAVMLSFREALDALNVKGVVVQSSEPGSEPRLEALLDTPKGRIMLA